MTNIKEMKDIDIALYSNYLIKRSIKHYIDAFVEFYGEDKRDEIEYLFNNMYSFAYLTPAGIKNIIKKFELETTNSIIEEQLKKHSLDLEVSDITSNHSFKNEESFKYNNIRRLFNLENKSHDELFNEILEDFLIKHKILNISPHQLQKYLNDGDRRISSLLTKKQKAELLNFFKTDNLRLNLYFDVEDVLKKITPSITFSRFNYFNNAGFFDDLKDFIYDYPKCYHKYEKSKEPYISMYNYLDYYEDKKQQLQREKIIKLVRKYEFMIPKEERFNLKVFYKTGDTMFLSEYARSIFGKSIIDINSIDTVIKQQEYYLQNSKMSKWRKNTIVKNLTNYLGKVDYEEEVKKYKIYKKIKEDKNKLLNEYYKELYSDVIGFKEIESEMRAENLISPPIDQIIYRQRCPFVMPAIKENNRFEKISYPILGMNFDFIDTETMDSNMIHELNHIYELNITGYGKNHISATCGWENVRFRLDEKQEDYIDLNEKKRRYELFNEIINELIAQDITKILHSNNYIFDQSEEKDKSVVCLYEYTKFIVKDFYDLYKEEIIESRRNGNIEIIWDAVGKENFEALNDLFKYYEEKISFSNVKQLEKELENNEVTDLTNAYYEIVVRKNEILRRMNEHYANKKNYR